MKMDANKMIGMVVGVMVGVLILSAALFPVIDSATTTEKTYQNEGYYLMSATDNADVTISWDHTTPTYLTVNDKSIKFDNGIELGRAVTIVGSESFVIRYVNLGTEHVLQFLAEGYYIPASDSDAQDMNVSLSNGSVTVTVGENTGTISYDKAYYVSDDGTWTMKKADKNAYVNDESNIMVLVGLSHLDDDDTGKDVGIYGIGDINGVEVDTFYAGDGVTFSTPEVNYTSIDGFKNLYSVSTITFDGVVEDVETPLTYSYFIVPAKVTAELAVHASQDEIDLLNTIPILITVGLILGIVGAVFVRRLE